MHFRSETLQFGVGPLDSVNSFVPVLSEFDEFSRNFMKKFFSKKFLNSNQKPHALCYGFGAGKNVFSTQTSPR